LLAYDPLNNMLQFPMSRLYIFYLIYLRLAFVYFFFFSSRRRHTRSKRDWSSDVCSSDLFFIAELVCSDEADGCSIPTEDFSVIEIGRASCRKECRSRWSPYHLKKRSMGTGVVEGSGDGIQRHQGIVGIVKTAEEGTESAR